MKSPQRPPSPQSGFTLIAALMILIVITIIGLALMRGVGLQGRMAGNIREKGRAFEAAQAAVDYAEWWLIQPGNASSATASCSAAQTSLTLCSGALTSPTDPSTWNGYTYALPNAGLASNAAFYQSPQLYIQYLGLNNAGNGALYQITALGYGGNSSSIVVLQSTYTLYSGVKNLGK
ncbi:pilus assembly PilX family protein [Chromobacterium alticapitis]|uniref:Pilus assembly protein PilX n=1 Tax=Chromobacterium alticapitis TaxID=2073169 RepID=A0A2S5DBT7_9NEIS|nr:PilX N-terminal domain-containing pilus assembly protein [Chromobacterium alticapitis]POZ60498.1 pilus assembly protein PilX [Chromobacterium alticapitis]